MKNSTSDTTNDTTTQTSSTKRAPALTILLAVAAAAAGWLIYEVATQTVELDRALDKTHASVGDRSPRKLPADSSPKIVETKAPVAGF